MAQLLKPDMPAVLERTHLPGHSMLLAARLLSWLKRYPRSS